MRWDLCQRRPYPLEMFLYEELLKSAFSFHDVAASLALFLAVSLALALASLFPSLLCSPWTRVL